MDVDSSNWPAGLLGLVFLVILVLWTIMSIVLPFVVYGSYSALLRIEKQLKAAREEARMRDSRDRNAGRL